MAYLTNDFQTRKTRPSGLSEGPEAHPPPKVFIENYLQNLSFSEDLRLERLVGAMRSSLLTGGERLRPALCLEVARSFGADPVEVLPSAAAIELIHTAFLVHDGLPVVDGGGPDTLHCHEKFDDATAILAGDAFLSESVNLVALHQRGTPEQLLEVVGELARSTGVCGTAGGRVLDDHLARAEEEPDLDALRALHKYKTSAFIEAAARIGAILAGASAGEKEIVSEYARQLGFCWQVTYEISNEVSKAAPADEDEEPAGGNGNTFVRLHGLSGAQQLADEALAKALEALEGLSGDTRGLAEMARSVRSG